MRRASLALLAFTAATGCGFALDPPSIVRTPRTLGVVAEPPELPMTVTLPEGGIPTLSIDSDLRLSALSFAPDGGEDLSRSRPLRHRFRACFDAARILSINGLPGGSTNEPCDLVPGSPEEGTVEPSVVLDRAWMAEQLLLGLAAFASLGGGGSGGGGGPVDLDLALLLEVGIALEVQHELLDEDGNLLLAAYKRVAVTTRDRPTTNPPPPTFFLGDTLVVGAPGSLDCTSWDGAPLSVRAREEITISPYPDDEWWQETFPVYDYSGGLVTGEENAYYSWFATAGALSPELSSPPDRDTTWTAPEAVGDQRLFVVLRDGHLGTSACSLRVTVTE